MDRIGLFPLKAILYPSVLMPLHVFEQRYRELVGRCISDDAGFGIARITSGGEAGGYAETEQVGTIARIREHRLMPDGRYVLLLRGGPRFRIVERLDDSVFPAANVELVDDDLGLGLDEGALDHLRVALDRYVALSAEADEIEAYVQIDLDDDPERASFEAAAIVRLADADGQMLLEVDTPTRVAWLSDNLESENSRLETSIRSR